MAIFKCKKNDDGSFTSIQKWSSTDVVLTTNDVRDQPGDKWLTLSVKINDEGYTTKPGTSTQEVARGIFNAQKSGSERFFIFKSCIPLQDARVLAEGKWLEENGEEGEVDNDGKRMSKTDEYEEDDDDVQEVKQKTQTPKKKSQTPNSNLNKKKLKTS